MNLLKLAVILIGVALGIATGHIAMGLYWGFVAGLAVVVVQKHRAKPNRQP